VATVTEMKREAIHTLGSTTVTRIFQVTPYAYVPTVLTALLGEIIVVGNRFVRTPPARDPIYRGCWCTEAKEVPFEVLNTPGNSITNLAILYAANYSNSAVISATYKTLDAEQTGGPQSNEKDEKELAAEAFDFGARNITLPNQYYACGTASCKIILAQEGLQATKTIPTVEYQLTRHYVATLPDEAITELCGRVNNDVFRVGSRTWAKEMLRFDGLHSQRKITTKSLPLWELVYKFAIQATYDKIDDSGCSGGGPTGVGHVGWNRIFRPSIGKWVKITLAADDTRSVYLPDSDISQNIGSRTVSGFDLLFAPGAK
jgi:hypothetical protein